MNHFAKMLLAVAVLAFPQTASAAFFDLIEATGTFNFASTGGVVTIDETVLPGNVLAGSDLHLEFQLDGNGETLTTTDTRFESISSADFTVMNGGDLQLFGTVNFVDVTSANPGPGGSSSTGFVLGTTVENDGESLLTIGGGSQAAAFGGVGSTGQLWIQADTPTVGLGTFYSGFGWFAPGFFDDPFSAQANVKLQFHSPEPGTLLLVVGGLAGLAAAGRRARR